VLVAGVDSGTVMQTPYYSMTTSTVTSSAQTHYRPDKVSYRFMGFQMFMSSDERITERSVSDAGEVIADIGGMSASIFALVTGSLFLFVHWNT
jgi:hypothetical protein